ncbi:MAG: acyl-CoA thioesterase [Lachnospiraceae bacterium]|nr:acyl-CoA thioesterase [Lachnospiraceae bacterium]
MSYIYIHKTQYYESDQMGIIHHSNYIRWFEEARTAFLDDMGYAYARLEHEGVVCPILSIECEYHRMMKYGDTARIEVEIEKFNGIKLIVKYRVYLESTGALCSEGRTSQCFLDGDHKPISMKKYNTEFYEKLSSFK